MWGQILKPSVTPMPGFLVGCLLCSCREAGRTVGRIKMSDLLPVTPPGLFLPSGRASALVHIPLGALANTALPSVPAAGPLVPEETGPQRKGKWPEVTSR